MIWALVVILLLLGATLAAWLLGWTVYPFGILVLLGALIAILLARASRERDR